MHEILYLSLDLDETTSKQYEAWAEGFVNVIPSGLLSCECVVRSVPDELRAKVREALEIDDIISVEVAWASILAVWSGRKGNHFPNLVVFCDPSGRLARMAKAEAPHALWGIRHGIFSAIYHPEPALVWHEMFHLLEAEDCYEASGYPDCTCGNKNCVMQYAPNLNKVGDPPFLCEKNREIIRANSEKRFASKNNGKQ